MKTSLRLICALAAALVFVVAAAGGQASYAQFGFVPSPVRVVGPEVSGRTVGVTVSLSPTDKGVQIAPLILPASAFSVREGTARRPATVERLTGAKLEVAVVADTELSATDATVVQATAAAVIGGLPPEARVAVLAAAKKPAVLSAMSTDRASSASAIRKLQPTNGEGVVDAIRLAATQFSRRAGVRRTLVVLEGPFAVDADANNRISSVIDGSNIDTYVIQTSQAALGAGNFGYTFPIGTGRVFYGLDADMVPAGRRLVAELLRQYRVTFRVSGRVDPTLIHINIRSLGKTLDAVTLVDLHLKSPTTHRSWLSVAEKLGELALGVAVLFGLLWFIPARRAKARAREPAPIRLASATTQSSVADGSAGRSASIASTVMPTTLTSIRPGPGLGGEQVEGREAVRELLRAQTRQVRAVWLADDSTDPEIEELASHARVPLRRASWSEIDSVSHSTLGGGVLAHAAPLPTNEIDDLGGANDGPVTVILVDHLADASLGALIRTAASCGVTGAVLVRQRPSPITAVAAAVARGAIEKLHMVLSPSLATAAARLRANGFLVIGIEAAAPERLLDLDVDIAASGVALVVDGRGRLDDAVRARCDVIAGVDLGAAATNNAEGVGQRACIELARCRIPGAIH